MKTVVEEMEDAKTLAEEAAELFLRGESTDYVIAYFAGVFEVTEEYEPDKTYPVTEIHDLFEMLYFNVMEKFKE